MSDSYIRELERAVAAGDPRASGRLLHERVRVGLLDRGRLDLAAYLGDPTARAVVTGIDQLDPAKAWREADARAVEVWVRGLEDWSREATVRAAIAIGRSILARWETVSGWVVQGQEPLKATPLGAEHFTIALEQALAPRRAVEAAEAWVTCPCAAHTAAAEAASWGAITSASSACCFAVARSMSTPDFAVQAVIDAREVLAEEGSPEDELKSLVRAALVPWALNQGDSIRLQPRLAPAAPEPFEWEERGWLVSWEERGGQVALRVALGGWSAEHTVGVEATGHAARLRAVVELDARLWAERRWLPPRPEGRGHTRTLRIERDGSDEGEGLTD